MQMQANNNADKIKIREENITRAVYLQAAKFFLAAVSK